MADNSEKKILAIIPAYNEEENIREVVQNTRNVDTEMDILVIDDGSKDGTARIARHSGAKVIRLSSHMGYGVALQVGYKYAHERGYDYLVQLDADGQHNPSYIPDLLTVVTSGDADMVLGSRFLNNRSLNTEHARADVPSPARKLGIRLFSFLTTLLVGFKVSDPTSGFQAFNRQVIAFFTRDFFPCDYPDADVILIAHRAGFSIKEIPMVIFKRNNGKSMHRGLRPTYYTFKMFLSILMTMLRKKPTLSDDNSL